MDTVIKFLLTQWAGAPLVIWILGVLAVLVMFIIGGSKRIRLKTTRGEFDFQKQPTARKRTKPRPPDGPSRLK